MYEKIAKANPVDDLDAFCVAVTEQNTTWEKLVVADVDLDTGEVGAAGWFPWPFRATLYFMYEGSEGVYTFGRITRATKLGMEARIYHIVDNTICWAVESFTPVWVYGKLLLSFDRSRIPFETYDVHRRVHSVDHPKAKRKGSVSPSLF